MTLEKEKINDVGCGFIAMSMPTFLSLDLSRAKGYNIEAWIKMQIRARNIHSVNMPVTCTYYEKSAILRGIRMFLGVEIFIIIEGLRYRLWNKKNYLKWLERLTYGNSHEN
jgi:hypothetical protein